jgi:aldehyde dehydrogenase (NAD+)
MYFVLSKQKHPALAKNPGPARGAILDNEPITGLALYAPFGGFKGSSANTFKKQGQAAVDFYTRTKRIYVNHE